uniref:Uncharacterized protein n=1 Tax=Arundo donax TaxID=35708 RepID=A0A0A9EW68_ARUDO
MSGFLALTFRFCFFLLICIFHI